MTVRELRRWLKDHADQDAEVYVQVNGTLTGQTAHVQPPAVVLTGGGV